jgi:hypothetical protein
MKGGESHEREGGRLKFRQAEEVRVFPKGQTGINHDRGSDRRPRRPGAGVALVDFRETDRKHQE